MIFPVPKSKFRLLEVIYYTPGVCISKLFKEAKVSPKSGYRYLKELRQAKIIKQETVGERPLLKKTFPDLKSEAGKLMFSLLESDRKIEFLNKHKEFIGPFEQLTAGLKGAVHSVVIFGSYARNSETPDSDLDILFIAGKTAKKIIEETCEMAFVTLKTRISPRMLSKEEFLKLKEKDEMVNSIIKSHICMFKPENFIELLT